MSRQSIRSRRIIDSDESLPLLDCERLIAGDVQAHHFALRVKGIEVDVRDDAERAGRGGLREGGEVFVREFAAAGRVGVEGGGVEGLGGGRHVGILVDVSCADKKLLADVLIF